MKAIEALVGSRVALIDRGFVVSEGRIVYPTAEGLLEAVDSQAGTMTLLIGSDSVVFFRDALRCVREVPAVPEVKSDEPATAHPEEAGILTGSVFDRAEDDDDGDDDTSED
jgi:hypothetical protein